MRSVKFDEVQEALKKENSNILVINVLPADEYEREHIPGSINIPLKSSNFIERVKKQIVDEKNVPIIVYCSSLNCPASSEAAKVLEEAGFTNVMHFKGGMEEWRKGKRKLEASVQS